MHWFLSLYHFSVTSTLKFSSTLFASGFGLICMTREKGITIMCTIITSSCAIKTPPYRETFDAKMLAHLIHDSITIMKV